MKKVTVYKLTLRIIKYSRNFYNNKIRHLWHSERIYVNEKYQQGPTGR